MNIVLDDIGIDQQAEQERLDLRNLERKLWNAEHTFESNKNEFLGAHDPKLNKHSPYADQRDYEIDKKRRLTAMHYWTKEIEKIKGAIFKHCLKTGLNSERGWNH